MARAKNKKTQTKPKSSVSGKVKSDEAKVQKSQQLKFGKQVSEAEKQDVKSKHVKISPAYKLLGRAGKLLVQHWKLFGGVLLVYALLNLVLVGVAGASSLQQSKSTLEQAAHGGLSNLSVGFTLFTSLIGSNSGSNANAGVYQTILLLLISVAFIWTLRQVYADQVVRIRDAFYSGVYPIVPFILILLVIGVQLLPFAIGGVLYGALMGGITVGVFEQIIALAIFLALAAWSLYMLCASILALYIVTLPDMAPIKALKSARQLVRFRRWIVLRKLLFLPLALLVIAAIIVIPFALFVTPLATLLFFVLSVLAIGVLHSYLYALYRELL